MFRMWSHGNDKYRIVLGNNCVHTDKTLLDKDYGYTVQVEPLSIVDHTVKPSYVRLTDTTPFTKDGDIVETYPYFRRLSFRGMYMGGSTYLGIHSMASYNPVMLAEPKTSWVRDPSSHRLVRIPTQVPHYHPCRINIYLDGKVLSTFDLTETDIQAIYEEWNILFYGGMNEPGTRITPPMAAHIRLENDDVFLTISLRTKSYYDDTHILASNRIYDEISGVFVDLKHI